MRMHAGVRWHAGMRWHAGVRRRRRGLVMRVELLRVVLGVCLEVFWEVWGVNTSENHNGKIVKNPFKSL